MRQMPAGQYLPIDSLIHNLDARVKVISLFLLIATIIMTESIVGYLLMIAIIAIIVASSKIPLKNTLASIKKLWLFMLVIIIMNSLFFNSENPIWSYGIIRISEEGIRQGINIVFNIMLIMILSNILTSTTAPMDITFALESLMKPLKLFRIPVEDITMIISVAIQFIPTLIEETETIKKAQTARGARFESKKLAQRAASFLPLIIPVFISAFNRADELSVAMEARGYRNAKNRTKKEAKPMKFIDYAALCTSVAICVFRILTLKN